jgi:hypothetical protein
MPRQIKEASQATFHLLLRLRSLKGHMPIPVFLGVAGWNGGGTERNGRCPFV